MKNILLLFSIAFLRLCFAQSVDWTQKANPALQSINGVVFRQDGGAVLSGTNCHPASIRMFDVATGNLNWDYTVGSNYMCIMGLSFSSNNNYIAAIEEFGNIFIFDNSGTLPLIKDTLSTGTSYAFATVIAPNNQHVAVACADGKLLIYNLSDGSKVKDIAAHPGWVTCLDYSTDGNIIVTGGDDNKVKVWNTNGSLIHTFSGHNSDITHVKITPDNQFVVSASKDDKIKVWDINSKQLIRTISGHTNDVNAVDLSPNGKMIVSASSDSTCRIWDFDSGQLLTTFAIADSGKVNSVAWSPLGNKIATGNEKSDVVLWSLPGNLGLTHPTKTQALSVYPNPATTQVKLLLPNGKNLSEVTLFDLKGKKLITNRGQEVLTVDFLEAGTYFLSLYTQEGECYTTTLIKE